MTSSVLLCNNSPSVIDQLNLSITLPRSSEVINSIAVFQLENEKGRAPGRALCAKWAREGTFQRKQTLKL